MRSLTLVHTRSMAVLAALALAAPVTAHAAEVTRVASSFDEKNPFDLDLNVGFSRTQRRGKITRENHQDGVIADVTELRYSEITQSLPMRLSIGIFQDLELHVGTSFVFNDDKNWRFPVSGTDETNSTIANNCSLPTNGTIAGCSSADTTSALPIFPVPGNSYRGGFSNIMFGFAWAPLSDVRDESKPKWLINVDYVAPNGPVAKPGELTSDADRGSVSDKVQRFNFSTALSKRLGAVDPYVKLSYSLPWKGPNYYSNCQNPDVLGYESNCLKEPWGRNEAGIKPPHVVGLLFGAEFFAYDDPSRKQTVGFDIQFGGQWTSEGRTYNELSDALQKLLYQDEYLSVGGSIGIYARAAEYVQLKLNASLYHDTEHLLTNEPIGKDIDGSCSSRPGSKCVDLPAPGATEDVAGEINPSFDFRYDMPGRRFRISEVSVFTVTATAVVNF